MRTYYHLCIPVIIIFLLLSLASVFGAEWTFMVYLDGDNNLEDDAIGDFLELASQGSDSNINILVLFDRIPGESSAFGDWTDTRRGIILNADVPDTSWGTSLGELNMGDPQTLVNFLTWGITTYPANKYAVILWNHGNGWRDSLLLQKELIFKSVCSDDTNYDSLRMSEVRNAFETFSATYGDIDLVGFDACLMGMLEVAYEIKDTALIMAASEETVPVAGWPYNTILSDLKATPSMSPDSLGIVIVNRYYESYSNGEVASAVDLSMIDALATQVDNLAAIIISDYQTDETTIKAAATATIDAISSAVVHQQHGTFWPGAHGLAIYFPATSGAFSGDYKGTVINFPAYTLWEEFLAAYYTDMTDTWIARCRSAAQEFYYPEHIDLYDFCKNLLLFLPPEQFYTETIVTNEYVGNGTAKGWNGDDQMWQYTIPFPFPFFRQIYTSVYVCSNGYLDFENTTPQYDNSTSGLANNKRIAPLWDDLVLDVGVHDIYITEATDFVIIRWSGKRYIDSSPVDFEVVLMKNGLIKFNYGNGNTNLTATIGISLGDGNNYYLSQHNGLLDLTNADSALWTPYVPLVASFTFTNDEEGWNFAGTIPPYDTPSSIWESGHLGLSAGGSNNSFSYWSSQPFQVDKGKVYLVSWNVGSSAVNPDETVDFRLRANQIGTWRAWDTIINSNNLAAPCFNEIKTYELVVFPQTQSATTDMQLSFDILGFDASNALSSWLFLEDVSVQEIEIIK